MKEKRKILILFFLLAATAVFFSSRYYQLYKDKLTAENNFSQALKQVYGMTVLFEQERQSREAVNRKKEILTVLLNEAEEKIINLSAESLTNAQKLVKLQEEYNTIKRQAYLAREYTLSLVKRNKELRSHALSSVELRQGIDGIKQKILEELSRTKSIARKQKDKLRENIEGHFAVLAASDTQPLGAGKDTPLDIPSLAFGIIGGDTALDAKYSLQVEENRRAKFVLKDDTSGSKPEIIVELTPRND